MTSCRLDTGRADLVIVNGAEPETVDPALITGQPEGRVANALFEGLTAFDEHGRAVPGVASHWEISTNQRDYTFHIRPNARWSNGDTVTAQDFLDSWRRTLEPRTASDYAYMLHPIRGAREFNEGATSDFSSVAVRAPDPHRLEVGLVHPTPYFLDLCAFITFAPVHFPTIARHGDDWVKPGNIVSNGAFLLDVWRLNDRIRLRRNPLYWNHAEVRLETVDILPISSANVAFNHYYTGVADVLLDKGLTPVALIDELRRRPDFHAAPFLANYFLRFNVTRPALSDPRVRRAFAMAIDRDRIVTKITRAGELPAYGFVPPGTANHQPISGLPYDPAEARRLLAEAGYPEGRGFPLVSYLYNSSELNDAVAVEIQAMVKEQLGIDLLMRKQEWKVYLNSLNKLDYDIGRSSWVGDYNDPNTFLDLFLTGGGNNRTGYGNPQYDALITAAAAAADPAERRSIFYQAERLLVEQEAPIAPLYYFVGIQMFDKARIGGLEANLLDEHPIRRMFLRPK